MKKAFTIFLVLYCSIANGQDHNLIPFPDGARVCFIGNSITHDGRFLYDALLYHHTRFPDREISFFNCGIAGDVTTGVLDRMEQDILSKKPAYALVMLGMNDVDRALYGSGPTTDPDTLRRRREAITVYRENLEKIVRILLSHDIRVILEKPTIYDQTAAGERAVHLGVNDALHSCAMFVEELAGKYRLPVVDYWTPMEGLNREMQDKDPGASILSADRVHPGNTGHFVMTWQLLKSLGAPRLVSEIVIDSDLQSSSGKSVNCRITEFSRTDSILSFLVKENALPFPAVASRKQALELVPFTRDLNMEALRVSGIMGGRYSLQIDDVLIGTFSGAELEKGINLASYPQSPQFQQALRVREVLEKLRRIEVKTRDLKFIEANRYFKALQESGRGQLSRQALDSAFRANYTGSLAFRLGKSREYFENKPRESEMLDSLAMLREKALKAAQPVEHRYLLRKLDEFSPERFAGIPTESGVRTWWHWIDGNITREGIRKDLEAMKEQGITQATILNVGLFHERFFGLDDISFGSPEWYGMFRYALELADSLGLTMGVHNCDGWSTSGGPWIKPVHSMKEISWSIDRVEGGKRVVKELAEPYSSSGFYRDVAVLAIRSDTRNNSFVQAAPAIRFRGEKLPNHLGDGCPVGGIAVKKGDTITLEFGKAFRAEKVVIHPRKSYVWGGIEGVDNSVISYTLEAGNRGQGWEEILRFETEGFNQTRSIAIPRVKARSFRLIINSIENTESFFVGELEFLESSEIPSYATDIPWHQAKVASVQGSQDTRYYEAQPYGSHPLQAEDIIDLTGQVNASGLLEWDAPPGTWELVRFGYTSTGTTTRPATASGTGLECDKMDTTALNMHYRGFPAKLVEEAGEYLGNTFSFLLVDSWECYFQNWTAALPEEFEKLNGYSMIPWIPVLCGEVVESPLHTESFLYDFRRTIASMIEHNYYGHLAELCHRDGLELHGEVIYGGIKYPPVDVLRAYAHTDMPMYEFWARPDRDQLYGNNMPPGHHSQFASSAGLFYGKALVGSEAYTGYATYSASPWEIKPFGDVAYTSGINQMILHSYVHQPTDRKPGLTLENFGLCFNRNNTTWEGLTGWLAFQARTQYLLQSTEEVNDLLYYVGDALPQTGIRAQEVPPAYHHNVCNFDILENRLHVEDHRIVADNGATFSLLVLPGQEEMNYATLLCLEELIRQGAYVYGGKPARLCSLSELEEHASDFEELSAKIWGRDEAAAAKRTDYGKGAVFTDMPLEDVLEMIGLPGDFVAGPPDAGTFIFSHRQNEFADLYFVANQLNRPVSTTCRFRTGVHPPVAEIWNPLTGEIRTAGGSTDGTNGTLIDFDFKSLESLFFVFRKEGDDEASPGGAWEIRRPVSAVPPAKRSKYEITEFEGSVSFFPAYEGEVSRAGISALLPLTESGDPDIRYFAGKALYSLEFQFPFAVDTANFWFICTGNLHATASVSLNGRQLGDVWVPYQELAVDHVIRQGKNVLELAVDIPYRNRFIGDFIQYGEVRSLWTTSEIGNYLDGGSPLKPSGLSGPLKIISISK